MMEYGDDQMQSGIAVSGDVGIAGAEQAFTSPIVANKLSRADNASAV